MRLRSMSRMHDLYITTKGVYTRPSTVQIWGGAFVGHRRQNGRPRLGFRQRSAFPSPMLDAKLILEVPNPVGPGPPKSAAGTNSETKSGAKNPRHVRPTSGGCPSDQAGLADTTEERAARRCCQPFHFGRYIGSGSSRAKFGRHWSKPHRIWSNTSESCRDQ